MEMMCALRGYASGKLRRVMRLGNVNVEREGWKTSSFPDTLKTRMVKVRRSPGLYQRKGQNAGGAFSSPYLHALDTLPIQH